jgi:methyl-accepting chemotaxis protein
MLEPDPVSVAAGWLQILSVVGAVIFGIYRIRKSLDHRDSEMEKRLDTQIAVGASERERIMDQIEVLRSDLNKEFGGNSGGMREAINRISDTMDRVDVKSNSLAVEVAELRGRYDQHMLKP